MGTVVELWRNATVAVLPAIAPCAFCDSDRGELVDTDEINRDGAEVFLVWCPNCMAEGPPSLRGPRPRERVTVLDLQREAIEQWNMRKGVIMTNDEKKAMAEGAAVFAGNALPHVERAREGLREVTKTLAPLKRDEVGHMPGATTKVAKRLGDLITVVDNFMGNLEIELKKMRGGG